MKDLTYRGRIGGDIPMIGTGVRDLETVDVGGEIFIVATSGAGGGLMSATLNPAGDAQLSDSFLFAPSVSGAVRDGISIIGVGGVVRVIVGGAGSDIAVGYELESSGQFGARSDLQGSGLARPGTGLEQGPDEVIFHSGDNGILRCFNFRSSPKLNVGPEVRDTLDTFHAAPQDMATIGFEGRSFLMTACAQDTGISLFEMDAETGEITHKAALTPSLGLGLHDVPVALETAIVAGRGYGVIASAATQGTSAALSVVEITPQGRLVVTDHILDGLGTRFGRVTGLDVATVNDQTFVAAAGGDHGVSLFALIPGGRLVHLNSMAGTLDAGLASLSDIALVTRPDGLHILAADQAEAGVVHLFTEAQIGATYVAGGAGDTLNGSALDDFVVGGAGNDLLSGGDGDDIVADGRGIDMLTGGAGRDRFVLEFDGQTDQILDFNPLEDALDLSLIPFLYVPGQLDVQTTSTGALLTYRDEILEIHSASGSGLSREDVTGAILWDTDRPPLIIRQSIDGGAQDETLTGGDGQDLIRGYGGNDQLAGLGGDDEIESGLGRDTIYGGWGHDTIRALDGDDLVFGGDGRDLVTLGAGNDLFNDNAQGGVDGQDTVFGGDGEDTIQGGNGHDVFYGERSNDVIFGRLGNDSLYGGFGFDRIYAGSGDDFVRAGDGRDLAFLGEGNDLFVDTEQTGENGRDTVFGGTGNDLIEGGGANDVFYGEDGNDILNGREGDDVLYGGASFDTIYGGQGDDRIWAGNGRDLIFMGPGHDLFLDNRQGGDLGRDKVFSGAGHDTIEGGNGNDTFFGEDGDDLIFGRKGDDLIFGGKGRDTIDGGPGNDVIWGGKGDDSFIFRTAGERDEIHTFNIAEDTLVLDTELWGGATFDAAYVVDRFAVLTERGVTLDFGGDSVELHGLTSTIGLADALMYV